MDQREYNIETIVSFLQAYPIDQVKAGVSTWAKIRISKKMVTTPKDLWIVLPEGETTEGKEWREINGVVYIRNPHLDDDRVDSVRSGPVAERTTEKRDMTPTVTMLKCPVCDGGIIREAVCSGCSLGRLGFVFRYICQNDTNHVMYSMNKAGLDKEIEEQMEAV